MYHLIDYVWTVENFSRYLDQQEKEVYPLLTSPVFSYKNTRWVLNLYPEGLGDHSSQNYLSLFIKYVSEDPETINAKVELSLLNNKNEKVYCRDTGEHQYQTFIDFGYKQFIKIQELKEQKADLLIGKRNLKIFARVELNENLSNLPLSLTWCNYDLLLLKDNLRELYEQKYLCDLLVKFVIKKKKAATCHHRLTSNDEPANLYHPYSHRKSAKSESNEPGKRRRSKLKKASSNFVCSSTSTASSINDINESSSSSSCSSSYSYETGACSSCASSTSLSDASSQLLEIKAHKFILASRSGKFRDLLKSNLVNSSANDPIECSEPASSSSACASSSSASSSSSSYPSDSLVQCNGASTNEASIGDVLFIETAHNQTAIEYLISYIYTGFLENIDNNYLKEIYEISKEFKVHSLTNLTREHMIKELNIDTCCDYLIFAVINNDNELNSKIQTFITEKVDCIIKTNAYKSAKRKYRELFENTFNDIMKKTVPASSLTHSAYSMSMSAAGSFSSAGSLSAHSLASSNSSASSVSTSSTSTTSSSSSSSSSSYSTANSLSISYAKVS